MVRVGLAAVGLAALILLGAVDVALDEPEFSGAARCSEAGGLPGAAQHLGA